MIRLLMLLMLLVLATKRCVTADSAACVVVAFPAALAVVIKAALMATKVVRAVYALAAFSVLQIGIDLDYFVEPRAGIIDHLVRLDRHILGFDRTNIAVSITERYSARANRIFVLVGVETCVYDLAVHFGHYMR